MDSSKLEGLNRSQTFSLTTAPPTVVRLGMEQLSTTKAITLLGASYTTKAVYSHLGRGGDVVIAAVQLHEIHQLGQAAQAVFLSVPSCQSSRAGHARGQVGWHDL